FYCSPGLAVCRLEVDGQIVALGEVGLHPASRQFVEAFPHRPLQRSVTLPEPEGEMIIAQLRLGKPGNPGVFGTEVRQCEPVADGQYSLLAPQRFGEFRRRSDSHKLEFFSAKVAT